LVKHLSNADAQQDVIGALERIFVPVSVDDFIGGAIFIASASKSAHGPTAAPRR
jgi:hypothetical protein